jgi:hypothetical protein
MLDGFVEYTKESFPAKCVKARQVIQRNAPGTMGSLQIRCFAPETLLGGIDTQRKCVDRPRHPDMAIAQCCFGVVEPCIESRLFVQALRDRRLDDALRGQD